MKQAASLFFILLFFFNLVGYRFVFDYMQVHASAQMEAQLDNEEYNESQLIELKVPINIPYQTNWSSYQRYDGKIQIDGHVYKYVKRKVANDTLYLLCIRDSKTQNIETAKNDFFKMTNDFTQDNHSKNSDHSKNLSFKIHQSDYDDFSFNMKMGILSNMEKSYKSESPNILPSFPTMSPEQPPDALFV